MVEWYIKSALILMEIKIKKIQRKLKADSENFYSYKNEVLRPCGNAFPNEVYRIKH